MSVSGEFLLPVRVYIEDTDAGGIVYYVNYLKYMERGRTELLRALGYAKTSVLDDELLFVVHSVQVKYRRPARLDDEVVVATRAVKIARAYVVFDQQVRRGDELLCEAEVKVACVDKAMRPAPTPAPIKASLEEYLRQ